MIKLAVEGIIEHKKLLKFYLNFFSYHTQLVSWLMFFSWGHFGKWNAHPCLQMFGKCVVGCLTLCNVLSNN